MGKRKRQQAVPRSPTGRELVILSILLKGKLYGREIQFAYERRMREELPAGSLYTTLDRMEDKGYVRSLRNERARDRYGPVRRYFRLTSAGKQTLKRYARWTALATASRRRRG